MSDKTEPADYLSGGAVNLLAQIVSQNVRDAAFTSDTLINGYKDEAETLRATLKAIRYEFTSAMGGQYMPSPGRLLDILYPSDELIDEYRQ